MLFIVELNESLHGLDTKVPTSTAGNIGSLNASKPENQGNMNESLITDGHVGVLNSSRPEYENKTDKGEMKTDIKLPKSEDNSSTVSGSVGEINSENGTKSGRRLLEDNESKESQEGNSETNESTDQNVHAATVENDEGLEADADSSFELFRGSDELGDEYSYDYDDYVDESMWGDEEWTEAQHEKLEDYVNIDSHILCTPVSINFIVKKVY